MKEERHEWSDEDQVAVDRLVDGELDAESRRALLASLDFTPDGWRRLALAFLEAQTWRQEFASALPPPAETGPTTTVALRPAPRRRWETALAAAACFLLAFVLGRQLWNDPLPEADGPTAGEEAFQASDRPRPAGQTEPLRDPSSEAFVVESSRRDGDSATLEVDDGRQPLVELPVWAVGNHPPDVSSRYRPALPRYVIEALGELGHAAVSRRTELRFELDDGRRVVVPIEEVEIQPFDRGAYQ